MNAAALTAVEHDNHVDRLYGVAQAIRALEDARDTYVLHAREAGVPWQSIAVALGITRQGAQQKYGRQIPDPAQMALDVDQDVLGYKP